MGRQQSASVSSVGHLIERQMILYEEKRKLARQDTAPELKGSYNFITISRDVGAMGDAVASEIASRLKWKVYDKEIVDYIAKHSRVRHNLVDQMDEKTQSLLQDSVSRLLRVLQGQPGLSKEEYHIALINTLAALAAKGSAILLGHGGAFVLQEQPGLHVRITASLSERVKRLSKRWNMPMDKTRRSVRKTDVQRRDFIRHHFNQDRDDARFYHLVFNTDHLALDHIVAAILGIIECSRQQAASPAPASYEHLAFHSSEHLPG